MNKTGSRLQASGFRNSQTSKKSSEENPEARSLKPEARFPKQRRLLRHADFEQVYKQGRRHFAAHMTVFYLRRDGDSSNDNESGSNKNKKKSRNDLPPGLRVGFTVGRVLGGSVQRNRMKRRLREAVRLSGFPPEVSADVVINPKRSLLGADFEDVRNQVARAFQVIEKAVEKITEKAVERTPEKVIGKVTGPAAKSV